jgi:hypothetical protein
MWCQQSWRIFKLHMTIVQRMAFSLKTLKHKDYPRGVLHMSSVNVRSSFAEPSQYDIVMSCDT